MIQIPNEYIKKVLLSKPIDGKKWLENINFIIQKYCEKFDIQQVNLIPILTENVILNGYSNILQENVILKIAKPWSSIENEEKMLSNYGNYIACKCFFSDKKDNVLILEKLVPGQTLKEIDNRKQRVEIFTSVMKDTIIDIDKNNDFPTYESRINKYFDEALYDKSKYKDIIELIPIAYKLYKDIIRIYTKQYLLHGDLGHKNIIKSNDNWKIIDPQGVISSEIFEIIKFVRGEIEYEKNYIDAFLETSNYLSKQLNYPRKDIAIVTFIELIRSISWKIGDNKDKDNINKNLNIAKELLPLCQ